jgi:hypothetical protein
MDQSELVNVLLGSSFAWAYDNTTNHSPLVLPPGDVCMQAVNSVVEGISTHLTRVALFIGGNPTIQNTEFALIPPLDTTRLPANQIAACRVEVQTFVHKMALNLDASTPLVPLSQTVTLIPNTQGAAPDFYVTREQTLLTPDRLPGDWVIALKRTIYDHLSSPRTPLPLEERQHPLVAQFFASLGEPAVLPAVNQVIDGLEMKPGTIVDSFVLMKLA